jgi:tRNA/tmRNA/rRNA uracil-C5-methylase (TrmA/RlmC/RlmD family)
MSLARGDEVELTVDKPAAGGRMIARREGQVVLVHGAIPGERITARVERVERQLAFAATVAVLEPSPDRRPEAVDLLCGGCAYAHITYARQLTLKAEVVEDAFVRLGRIPLAAVSVAASPPEGYRMRARLHVKGEAAGFYREGTHELCDAGATRQLTPEAVAAAADALASLRASRCELAALELSENIAGDQRALHVTPAAGTAIDQAALDRAAAAARVTGLSARGADGVLRAAGVPFVRDPLAVLAGRPLEGALERHAESFFQANRFLLPSLVAEVLGSVPGDGPLLDLYAGVGLFSVSLAASGRGGITAVEGDRTSGRDLQRNAAQFPGVRVMVDSVERHLARMRHGSASAVIVDPPRTGISREAMGAVVAGGARRVVYVSCDPATMARDARRLLDGGYDLASLKAFDLFPNTAHVESVGVFDLVT